MSGRLTAASRPGGGQAFEGVTSGLLQSPSRSCPTEWPSGIRLLGWGQTPVTAFANISATFIRILLWPLEVREMLVPSDVILEPAARSWKARPFS